MRLTQTNTTEAYPIIRFISENKLWEVGVGELTIYGGFRIVAGKVGESCYSINYCTGNDIGWMTLLLGLIIKIMEEMEENISIREFEKTFPFQEFKPMFNDVKCLQLLIKLAKKESLPVASRDLTITKGEQNPIAK